MSTCRKFQVNACMPDCKGMAVHTSLAWPAPQISPRLQAGFVKVSAINTAFE